MKRIGLAVILAFVGSSVVWGEDESLGKWEINGEVKEAQPFIGVKHKQIIQKNPRPTVINVIEIDPKAKGVRFMCSPANGDPNGEEEGDPNLEVTRVHTPVFVEQVKAQVGINTAFYGDISKEHPYADIKGLAASEGNVYSNFYKGWPALNISADNVASIVKSAEPKANNAKTIPADAPIYNTIGGSHILLEDGMMPETKKWSFTTSTHPRTAVGWKKDGTILLVIVDGRQSEFSEGMTLFELADLFRDLGCENAINLDGGGSTTLAIADSEVRVANNPSDTFEDGRTGRPRFVAASLVVFAKPNPEYMGSLAMAPKPKPRKALPYPQEPVALEWFDIQFEGEERSLRLQMKHEAILHAKSKKTDSLHLKKVVIDESKAGSDVLVREYSGEGKPKHNVALGRVGTVTYKIKTTTPNLKASLVLDDVSNPLENTSKGHERGSTMPIIADGKWHNYAWDLRVVDHWFNYGGGNGVIDGPNTSLDSILILKNKDAEYDEPIELMISDVVYDPKGKLRQ
ncbi:phosphodiester glycosidase family protein [Planctomycetota bacterium]|nr:phosphodiester glycosidase family protein [Planctomycetota bacterium]